MSSRSGSANRPNLFTPKVIVALIAAVGTISVAWITVQSKEGEVRREMQATIVALETRSSQQAGNTIPPGVITVTQIVEVTSTPDTSIYSLDNKLSRSFAFAGGNDPNIVGQSKLSIWHTEMRKHYILDYSFPITGFTWAGLATIFESPISFAQYSVLGYKLHMKIPNVAYQIKISDKSSNVDYLTIDSSTNNSNGVAVLTEGTIQTVRVKLRGNFDKVNLEQINEVSIVTNSDLTKVENSFDVSDLMLLK